MPTTSRLSPHAVAFEPAGSIPTKSDNDHLVGVPKKEVADQNQPPNKNGKDIIRIRIRIMMNCLPMKQ